MKKCPFPEARLPEVVPDDDAPRFSECRVSIGQCAARQGSLAQHATPRDRRDRDAGASAPGFGVWQVDAGGRASSPRARDATERKTGAPARGRRAARSCCGGRYQPRPATATATTGTECLAGTGRPRRERQFARLAESGDNTQQRLRRPRLEQADACEDLTGELTPGEQTWQSIFRYTSC